MGTILIQPEDCFKIVARGRRTASLAQSRMGRIFHSAHSPHITDRYLMLEVYLFRRFVNDTDRSCLWNFKGFIIRSIFFRPFLAIKLALSYIEQRDQNG